MPNYTTKTGEVIALTMHPSEITREFNQAAKKVPQIKILADLNCCSTTEIARVLRENGVDVTSIPKIYRTKLEQEMDKAEPTVSTPAAEADPAAAKPQRNTTIEKNMGRARVSIELYDENGHREQRLTIDTQADEVARRRVIFLLLGLQLGLEDRMRDTAKRKEETA